MTWNAPTLALQVRSDFVLLRAGSLCLLLPQHDVNATEYMRYLPVATAAPGVFQIEDAEGQVQQVMALSEEMHLLPVFPADRFLLTRLGSERRQFSLVWNDVRVLTDTALELRPLPAVMQGTTGLIDAYAELDGKLAFCTTASRILAETQARTD